MILDDKKTDFINSYEDKNVYSYYDVDEFKILSQTHHIIFEQLMKAVKEEKMTSSFMNGTVIDVGCGTGNALFELSQKFQFSQLYGVEPSAEMLKIAKKKLPDLIPICDSGINIYKHFSEPVTDLLNLHFVFSFMDYTSLIQQAADIIKDGGILSICTTTNQSFAHSQALGIRYFSYLAKRLLKMDLKSLQKKYMELMPENTNELVARVEKSGCEILACDTIKAKIKIKKAHDAWNFLYNAGWFTAELQGSAISKSKISCLFYLFQFFTILQKKQFTVEDEIEIIVLTARKGKFRHLS